MKKAKEVKMVRKKICRAGYMLGYWKGEPVALMPKYHPDSNPDDFVVEEIEVEADAVVPRLIDPLETSLAEVKEICEENGIPLFWVTGLSTYAKDNIDLKKADKLDKAINLFIALNSAGTTTMQYRRVFDRLIKENIMDPAISIKKFLETSAEVIDRAYNLPLEKATEAKSRIFHILQSFLSFLKHPTKKITKERSGKYTHKREDFLADNESEIFFSVLKTINPAFELIGKLMRYLNREMYETQRDAPIIPLNAILHLKTEDLDQAIGYNVVDFYAQKTQVLTMFSFSISDELYERLLDLANKTDMYLFRNKKGAPIDPGQVRRAFVKASKLGKLSRIITPIHLR